MIGEMRHSLVLQELQVTPDGGGGQAASWSDIATAPRIFAAIEEISGGERTEKRGLIPRTLCRIVTRHRADIAPGMRLADETRAYHITAVLDKPGSKRYLEIIAEAVPLHY